MMDSGFCVDCLNQALQSHGASAIFNTDQGSQFAIKAFNDVLKDNGITISMDRRGRALDTIFVERLWRSLKHEDAYLKGYGNLPELIMGLTEYFVFYNLERMHQPLDYLTPEEVSRTATGDGACIVDKYGKTETTGQRCSAA